MAIGQKAPAAWKQVFFRYVVSYKERTAAKGAPYSMLRPLADTQALRKIKDVLMKDNKSFGGYCPFGSLPLGEKRWLTNEFVSHGRRDF